MENAAEIVEYLEEIVGQIDKQIAIVDSDSQYVEAQSSDLNGMNIKQLASECQIGCKLSSQKVCDSNWMKFHSAGTSWIKNQP